MVKYLRTKQFVRIKETFGIYKIRNRQITLYKQCFELNIYILHYSVVIFIKHLHLIAKIKIALNFVSRSMFMFRPICASCSKFMCVEQGGGGGVTRHIFGYGRAAGVSGPQPIHILGKVNKTDPFIYFP